MHFPRTQRSARGFTLFEFVIVISIVAILAGFLAGRLEDAAESAERASMEYTVNLVNSALLFEFASEVIHGASAEIPAMTETNPMDLMAQKPSNYLGEFDRAPPDDVQLGNWYYDTTDHLLVYLVRRGGNFEPDSEGIKRIRYRVTVLYDKQKSMVGMILSVVEPYKWG